MKYVPVINLQSQLFPFGTIQDETFNQSRKIYVRKRVDNKNQQGSQAFQQKIQILKKISHKNIINLEFIQELQGGYIDLFYGYVHHKFQDLTSFKTVIFKKLHEQLIKMVIYAAKNSILVSFDNKKCGFKVVNGEPNIKYYLPITQISISNDRTAIQRSVQLFAVQSMQYLDEIMLGRIFKQNSKPINSRKKSYSFQTGKDNLKSGTQLNIFSSRNLKNQIQNTFLSQRNLQKKYIAVKSANNTEEKEISEFRQNSLNSFWSSLERHFTIQNHNKQKIAKIKQRSSKALLKLNLIKIQLEKTVKRKQIKSTQNFNSLKRLSIDEQMRIMQEKL